MCGRYNISDDPFVRALMKSLGLGISPEPRKNVAPGAMGQFVVERERERQLLDGLWSLLIEPKPDMSGFRPSPRYKTFNAKASRLHASPLWKKRIHHQRAIVPVSGFHEWQGKQCYNITAQQSALALGGLYELWQFGEQTVPSFSVITLDPHPVFSQIHDKSIPLILQNNEFDAWLDPANDARMFTDLLNTHLPVTLEATPIDSPQTLNSAGAPLRIEKDQ